MHAAQCQSWANYSCICCFQLNYWRNLWELTEDDLCHTSVFSCYSSQVECTTVTWYTTSDGRLNNKQAISTWASKHQRQGFIFHDKRIPFCQKIPIINTRKVPNYSWQMDKFTLWTVSPFPGKAIWNQSSVGMGRLRAIGSISAAPPATRSTPSHQQSHHH